MLRNILFWETSVLYIMVNHLFSATLSNNFIHTVCALVFCGGWHKIDISAHSSSALKLYEQVTIIHHYIEWLESELPH